MTLNDVAETAVVALTVTDTVPVVAPFGTTIVSRVRVADVTVATVPPMLTVLFGDVTSKPLPVTTRVEPTGPAAGEKPLTASVVELRTMPTMFPTAS